MTEGVSIQAAIEHDLLQVEAALIEALASEIVFLAEASRYLIRAGGTRMCPRVFLPLYRVADGHNPQRRSPVPDDINDHSDRRHVKGFWPLT